MVPPDEDEEDEQATKKKVADTGGAFRREIAQVQFRNFVHEQQFYSWQFRSSRLYGRGETTMENGGENNGEINRQESNQEEAN